MTKKPHILIVEARFYDDIADMLLAGAKPVLDAAGATYEQVSVPGALEIPAVIRFAAESKKYDGYLALGCVIRGETYHFEVVSNQSARGLQTIALDHLLPIANGILTVDEYDQAVVRADPKQSNKGAGFAEAVLKMVELKRKFVS